MELFDVISRDPRAPNPHSIPYETVIKGICYVRNMPHDIGLRATYHQLQAKQTACCSIMAVDDDGALQNMPLLNAALPHSNDNCKGDWIKDYTLILNNCRAVNNKAQIFRTYEAIHCDSYVIMHSVHIICPYYLNFMVKFY